MAQNRYCPRCDGKMWEGFLLDRGDHDYQRVAEWIEGTPEDSFWSGTKIKGRARHRVQAYRCEKCGYLESYAPAQSS